MMVKPRLGIDIDGTLSQYDTFLPYLNKLLGTEVTAEQLIQYDMHEIFGMKYEEFCNIFDEHSIPMYQQSVPRPCAQKQLSWIDEHFNIFYITARYNKFAKLTQDWLIEHRFPNREIICTGSHDKTEALKSYNIQFMVEDRLENAIQIWDELRIPIYLLDTPYNQGEHINGICRVPDWHAIQEDMIKRKIV
jgi:uncharacterized HAD superfamily protein